MTFRPGQASDFTHLETFVWQAIFPAFDVDGLSPEQRAENDRTVETVKAVVGRALERDDCRVITAWDERRRAAAGYAVIDLGRPAVGEIVQLIVRRADWGQGIGAELLDRGLQAIGPTRDAVAALRHYNTRALSLYARKGLVDSGEQVGDYLIARLLVEKPATEPFIHESVSASESETDPGAEEEEANFPTAADEPAYTVSYAPLPDYRLATDEPAGGWQTPPTESFLDEEQRDELAEFIERARAKKKEPPVSKHPEIPFEVDYGTPQAPEEATAATKASPLDFEFAFDTAPAPAPDDAVPPPEDTLQLEAIPEEADEDAQDANDRGPSLADLRNAFDDRLAERLTLYFGADKLLDSLKVYRRDEDFHRIRDVALRALCTPGLSARKQNDTFADLTEYFTVETARDLHGSSLNQRILRYQAGLAGTEDRFRLVMDYLDFSDSDAVYTDFVTTPARVLRNATKSYLGAEAGERLYVICDQTLLGTGKQGFAVTDRGIYWKQVLQPAGRLHYAEMKQATRGDGHLLLNRQYFDAGSRLNLRVLLLLDRMRRLARGNE